MAEKEQYGYVKISRKAYESDDFWLERRVFSKWEAWEWMIQEAGWRSRTRLIGMTQVALERGEFVASVRFMAGAWRWSRSRVQEFIEHLKTRNRISGQRETQVGTVYLLVNYETYQGVPDSERTPERTASNGGQQADTNGDTGADTGADSVAAANALSDKSLADCTPPDGGQQAGRRGGQGGGEKADKREAKKNINNTSPTDLLFEAVWLEYPRKVGKGNALKAWNKLVVRGDPKAIEAGIYRYIAYAKALQTESRFIKHMATLLNSGEWQEDWSIDGVVSIESKKPPEEWWERETVMA